MGCPQLKSALEWLMSEAYDLGYIPSINNTKSTKLCLIVSNEDKGKVALLGTMTDEIGDSVPTACMVNIKGWRWAESEGFTWDNIMNDNKLFKKVFVRVPIDTLPSALA